MPTEKELTLEQIQQGVSYEVSVDPHGFEGYLKMDVKAFSTWMAFRGNTRDLGSFGEETDKTTTLHQEP
ncbi:hypothetical protein Tco_0736207 [Tanacetum coccineum]